MALAANFNIKAAEKNWMKIIKFYINFILIEATHFFFQKFSIPTNGKLIDFYKSIYNLK